MKDLPQRKIIVTNASNKVLARIKQLTINTGFEVFSYEANPLKESPEYFKQLIQELDLDISRTFYFDHDIKNVIAAQQVSIDSILYLNNQQIIDIIQDRNKRIRLIPGAIEEEPTKILFASTNMNKIQRFKDLTQELNLEVFSLTDLGLDKLPEPEENGESEIENATIKAKHYWQHLVQKMPVISQDDGVYNSGLPKEYQAGKDIKATVAKFIGQSDRKSIFLYWKMLAEKFNNPSITFRWSFAIYDGSKTDSTNCNVDGVLMAIPAKNYQEFIDSGAPISPLMQMDLGSQKIYFSNLNKVDYKELAHQNCSSLLELLGKQIKKNISTESLIPEQDLPLLLPQDLDMSSGMIKPLSQNHEFINSAAKKYGEGAKYEADTMDTFVCSSWYYFRYCSPNNREVFADKHEMEKWMPVDQYIIGAEHSTLHLLYARFFTKVLFDAGFINFEEPFIKMRHQGLILGPDNQKMSKSKGNVVNPNEVFDEYGADTLRMYEMFMGPFDQPKPWSTSSIKGVRRLLERVWNLQERVYYYKDEVMDKLNQNNINYGPQNENTIEYGLHKLIKKVGVDIESFSFNTSVAEYMKFMNLVELTGAVTWHQLLRFLIVLHPFAPFITEEIYHNLDWEHIQEQTKNQCLPKQSISQEQFPSYSEKYLIQDTVKMVVQINGKVRAEFEIDTNIDENIVLEQAKIAAASYLEGKTIKFSKVVPNKLVSFVIQ